jgi:hypothetical protein
MAGSHPSFSPSQRALEFGAKYAEVLARWGELFSAASTLVAAHVELGRLTAEAAKEFEDWLQGTANSPWSWLNPDSMQRFVRSMGGLMSPGAAPRSETGEGGRGP